MTGSIDQIRAGLEQYISCSGLDLKPIFATESQFCLTNVAFGVDNFTFSRTRQFAVSISVVEVFDLFAISVGLGKVKVFDILCLFCEDEIIVDGGLKHVLVELFGWLDV